jgi:hypothetical protein
VGVYLRVPLRSVVSEEAIFIIDSALRQLSESHHGVRTRAWLACTNCAAPLGISIRSTATNFSLTEYYYLHVITVMAFVFQTDRKKEIRTRHGGTTACNMHGAHLPCRCSAVEAIILCFLKNTRIRSCLDDFKMQKVFKISCHIAYIGICMEH